MRLTTIFFIGLLSLPAFAAEKNADWPQWRGPNRDGVSQESGLLKKWPENGPKQLWRVSTGKGFSSVVVAGGKVYGAWAKGNYEELICLDEKSGEQLWKHRLGTVFVNEMGSGPRSSPIVDDGLVYAIGARGNLHAVDAKSGEKAWSRNLTREYGTRIPRWGYSSSPLVEGNLLLVELGGKRGYAFAAFDKKTGNIVWHSESDQPGYSSPIVITMHGKKQVVFFSAYGLQALSLDDGKLLWKHSWDTNYNVNAAIPLFYPPNNILISSSYGVGAALVEVNKSGGRFETKQAWFTKRFKNHFNSSVLIGDYVYGFDNAILKCLDVRTGEEKWKARGFSKGSLIAADGKLIVLGEQGRLALVEATPDEYQEISSFQPLSGKCWSSPSLANGRLYVLNEKELISFDIRSK